MQNKINNHYQEIVQFFVGRGIEYWQACEGAKSLATYVIVTVMDEIMDSLGLDDRTQERLRHFLDTHPSPEQLCLFMGITKEEFDIAHERKLAQIVELLPQAYKQE